MGMWLRSLGPAQATLTCVVHQSASCGSLRRPDNHR
jgi:hypothetical protein